MNSSVIFIVQTENACDILSHWNYSVYKTDTLDESILKDYTWVLLLPGDHYYYVSEYISLQSILSQKLLSYVVRLYPFWTLRLESFGDLSVWYDLVDDQHTLFRKIIRSQLEAYNEGGGDLFSIPLISLVKESKRIIWSDTRSIQHNLCTLIDQLYIDVLRNTWITAEYFSTVWNDERLFRTAFYNEILGSLHYTSSEVHTLNISKDMMYMQVV